MILISYITVTDVRDISGLTTLEISDSAITTLIGYATAQFNSDVNTTIIRERALYLDNTRKNFVNSQNDTYYIARFKNYYLGDFNNDGEVTLDDVTVYLVAGDGTETQATISSIDASLGKIVLSTPPTAGMRVYITYKAAIVDESTPHFLVKLAVAQMTAALAFTRIDVKKVQNFAIGKVRITTQSQAYKEYFEQYKKTIDQIRRLPFRTAWRTPVLDNFGLARWNIFNPIIS